ncbi:DUF2484 family protein [Palleronia abyssalis]|uniref:DUF2484 family protein n=1 Tax=Palleronia abyssalis TaxID=1501240 RepID=A0A2R8BW66_9RHOB|nr:DUF2484 family protein [Palleronia abyssalis]SPJ24385.1 hypothetical protein PAA8504_02213 [Palleronia abyssalis]
MSPALVAACLWIVAGCVAGMLPARDNHWRAARVLGLTGVPILIWLVATSGLLAGAVFALAAASILRWPLIMGARAVRARVGGRAR